MRLVSTDKPADVLPPDEVVTEWSEQFRLAPRQKRVTFSGDSYESWLNEFSWVSELPKSAEHDKSWVVSNAVRVGAYYLYLREFPMWEPYGLLFFSDPRCWRRASLHLYDSRQRASFCSFDRVVHIPILLKVTDFGVKVWMSLTPNEVITQRAQIRLAKGRVGVAGLGMGWAVGRMLERRQVRHLTVVERDPDILQYFGEPLLQRFGDRLKLVCEDAYSHDWSRYDSVLWDIWPDMGDAYYDGRFQKLRAELRSQGITCSGWAAWSPRN